MAKIQSPSNNKGAKFKQISRPVILESKNNKIELLKQSAIIGKSRGGKVDPNSLPQGVIRSLENKKRIDDILNQDSHEADDIRIRLNISKKPLSVKTVGVIRKDILDRFELNRNKSGSRGINLGKLNETLSKNSQADVIERISEARKPLKFDKKNQEEDIKITKTQVLNNSTKAIKKTK